MSVALARDSVWCDLPWVSVYVTIDGMVRPCCDFRLSLGRLPGDDLTALWEGRFDALRALLNEGLAPPPCAGCLYERIGYVGPEVRSTEGAPRQSR